VKRIRRRKLEDWSIGVIQRVYRGYRGRKRFELKKELILAGRVCLGIMDRLYMKNCVEISKVEEEDAYPSVLTLLRYVGGDCLEYYHLL
jgi:hypothetical protein